MYKITDRGTRYVSESFESIIWITEEYYFVEIQNGIFVEENIRSRTNGTLINAEISLETIEIIVEAKMRGKGVKAQERYLKNLLSLNVNAYNRSNNFIAYLNQLIQKVREEKY